MSAREHTAVAVAGALRLLVGCAPRERPLLAPRAVLSSDDDAKVQALAHGAQGLGLECRVAPDPDAALPSCRRAVERDPLEEHPGVSPVQHYVACMLAEQFRELEEAGPETRNAPGGSSSMGGG